MYGMDSIGGGVNIYIYAGGNKFGLVFIAIVKEIGNTLDISQSFEWVIDEGPV